VFIIDKMIYKQNLLEILVEILINKKSKKIKPRQEKNIYKVK
jgi:hypothetical protein